MIQKSESTKKKKTGAACNDIATLCWLIRCCCDRPQSRLYLYHISLTNKLDEKQIFRGIQI